MIIDCIDMLEKELKSLRINLDRAITKPGVNAEEIANIERKIRLKTEILGIVRRSDGEIRKDK